MGQVEGRAVAHHARRGAQRDLAERQLLAIEFQRVEAPVEALQRQAAQRDVALPVPFELLEMLRPQEHPLGPHHPLAERRDRRRGHRRFGHGRPFASFSATPPLRTAIDSFSSPGDVCQNL